MAIRVEGVAGIASKLAAMRAAVQEKSDLQAMADEGAAIIVRRTLRGKDVDLRDFAPYSKSYTRAKAKRGGKYTPKRPNLSRSGEMLSAIVGSVDGRGRGVIAFNRQDVLPRAFAHNSGSGRQPKREFFALSRADVRALAALYRERVTRRIRRGR